MLRIVCEVSGDKTARSDVFFVLPLVVTCEHGPRCRAPSHHEGGRLAKGLFCIHLKELVEVPECSMYTCGQPPSGGWLDCGRGRLCATLHECGRNPVIRWQDGGDRLSSKVQDLSVCVMTI